MINAFNKNDITMVKYLSAKNPSQSELIFAFKRSVQINLYDIANILPSLSIYETG